MRKLGWIALCAAMALASSAHAVVLENCGGGCFTDFSGLLFNVNYTVPTDGRTYQWDLYSDAAHPNVLINLPSPDETFAYDSVSNGDGTFHFAPHLPDSNFTWSEIQAPGHTLIYTRSLLTSFNTCSGATPTGVICATTYNVWGNGVSLTVNVADRVGISFTSIAVPEPATWALLLTGFLGLGVALRRRRRLAFAGW